MALPNDLYTGIRTEYSNDADLLAALLGGLHNTEVRSNTFPYARFSVINENPDWTFTEDKEEFLIQFDIFDDRASSQRAGEAVAKLWACFDWCTLTVTGYTMTYCKRLNSHLFKADGVWQYTTDYEIRLEKN